MFHYFQGKAVLQSAEHDGRRLLLKSINKYSAPGWCRPTAPTTTLTLDISTLSDLQVLLRCLRPSDLSSFSVNLMKASN